MTELTELSWTIKSYDRHPESIGYLWLSSFFVLGSHLSKIYNIGFPRR